MFQGFSVVESFQGYSSTFKGAFKRVSGACQASSKDLKMVFQEFVKDVLIVSAVH